MATDLEHIMNALAYYDYYNTGTLKFVTKREWKQVAKRLYDTLVVAQNALVKKENDAS